MSIGFLEMNCKLNRGFSLLEILLIVVILIIIASIAIPNFSPTYTKFQLQETTQDITYLMRYAQSRAITKNHYLRIEFADDFKSYWLTEGTSNGHGLDFQRLTGRLGRKFKVHEKINVVVPEQKIKFYPNGTADKIQINVCYDVRCLTISTQERRGSVKILDERNEKY